MNELPNYFSERVGQVFGSAGREWLQRLPGLLAQCRAQWQLLPGRPSPLLRMNYIEFTRTAGGQEVALKIGVPDTELFTEMEALAIYAGRSAVRLLAADQERGAMLLQRIRPGKMLWELNDPQQETEIAAGLMARLPVPIPANHKLPAFRSWVERAFHLTRTEWDPDFLMPRELLTRAEAALAQIEEQQPDWVVLHGDLHQENILFDEQAGWLAIDPKGVVGPPVLESGRFLQNRLPEQGRQAAVEERLQILQSVTGHPRRLLTAAALVDVVLSHCWCFEEEESIDEEWQQGIELARVIDNC